MALTKQIVKTIPGFSGELTSTAYFKVSSLTGGKHGMSALVTGVVAGNQIYAVDHFFVPDLDGSNFIKQAYMHIKTLPEFAGAVDC
jgi:hypothetical protein